MSGAWARACEGPSPLSSAFAPYPLPAPPPEIALVWCLHPRHQDGCQAPCMRLWALRLPQAQLLAAGEGGCHVSQPSREAAMSLHSAEQPA